jgi:hypothetical protein
MGGRLPPWRDRPVSRNIHEIEANKEITPTVAFEATFSPLAIDEVLLEFDPKHSGPPVVVLGNGSGETKEIHMLPQRGARSLREPHRGLGDLVHGEGPPRIAWPQAVW